MSQKEVSPPATNTSITLLFFIFLTVLLLQYILLCKMRNTPLLDNKTKSRALEILTESLPAGWKAASTKHPTAALFNFSIRISSPDKECSRLDAYFERDLTPKKANTLVKDLANTKDTATLLVISPFLSPAARGILNVATINYMDFTGNIKIELYKPGLYIKAEGEKDNPDRKVRPSKSLRGEKAGQIARILINCKELLGVREIAKRIGIDPGYVSRVLNLLDREALVERDKRGRLLSVDWQKLIKWWAEDAKLEKRGTSKLFLAPRGLPTLEAKLASLKKRYAITASLAAAKIAPVAPPRLATIYVEDIEKVAAALDLREVDGGANVLLIEPKDVTILVDVTVKNKLRYVTTSQAALDLLSSPGRGQAEAEELLAWMTQNEALWRG